MRTSTRTLVAIVGLFSTLAAQAPAVVSMEPANGSQVVDPAIKEIVVTFDQAMMTGGFSFCGGGPAFPTIADGQRPFWRDDKTVVMPVALEPSHEYRLSLNCPAASNFRSAAGFALTPTPWSFKTRAGDAPTVVSFEPENGDDEVDPGLEELVVTFDQPMSQTGWSFCGGGESFPDTKRPKWRDDRTIVLPVDLEPEHTYRLSINCPAATNFRSASGTPARITPWTFTTLPGDLPDPKTLRSQNKKLLDEALKTLEANYSYYELRDLDWKMMRKEHEEAIVSTRSRRGWAEALAKMLEPTDDIHLSVRYRDDYFPTGRRAIDPLFRRSALRQYVPSLRQLGDQAAVGRTDDGIGYVMIGAWSDDVDLDDIERELANLKDAKALVIDVRPNSGGDELMAMRIAQWFVEGTRTYAKNRYRTGRNRFGKVLSREITGNEGDKRLALPVAVLTSRYVMSSCEAFVLMMRQAPNCTVVGQTTYGSSGNPKPHQLDNGVTIVIPSWQAMRPDGTLFEGKGLVPDVEVSVEGVDLTREDPILARALAILRGE